MDKCLNAWHPPKCLNALTPSPLSHPHKCLNVWSHNGWSSKLYFSFPSLQTPFHVLWKYVCISWYGVGLTRAFHDITWHHMTSYNIIWHHGSTVHKQWKYLYLSNWSEMQNSYLVQSRDVKVSSWHKLVPNIITEPPDITLRHIIMKSHYIALFNLLILEVLNNLKKI